MTSSVGKDGFSVDYDSHVHSSYSPDSEMSPGRACEAAIRRGLRGLCFTDHAEFAPGDFIPGAEDLEAMFAEVTELRRLHRGQLRVGAGIEIGYYAGQAADIRALLASYPFDFVLGSVHVVDGLQYCFDGPGSWDAEAYYDRYLDVMEEMLGSFEMDSVGHFDLPKRFGPLLRTPDGERVGGLEPGSVLWPRVQRILRAVVQGGWMLEVNGSGLRQPPGKPYPSVGILREYRAVGGSQVTLGSDSHATESLGQGLAEAAASAFRAGICTQVWTDGGKPLYISLGV